MSIITWDQQFYVAEDSEFGDAELEEDEDIRVLKLSPDRIIKEVTGGKIETSSTIAGLFMTNLYKNNKLNI